VSEQGGQGCAGVREMQATEGEQVGHGGKCGWERVSKQGSTQTESKHRRLT
jgi:hypothetical protein